LAPEFNEEISQGERSMFRSNLRLIANIDEQYYYKCDLKFIFSMDYYGCACSSFSVLSRCFIYVSGGVSICFPDGKAALQNGSGA